MYAICLLMCFGCHLATFEKCLDGLMLVNPGQDPGVTAYFETDLDSFLGGGVHCLILGDAPWLLLIPTWHLHPHLDLTMASPK